MIKILKEIDLKEYKLVIPSVSVGNVSQLAIDLILTTLQMSRLGYVWHRNIIPVVTKTDSGDPISTACELYVFEERKIVIMQIRSSFGPFITISPLFKELCNLVKCVVIVSGSFAYERKDIQMVEEPIKYLASPHFESSGQINIPDNWKELPENTNVNGRLKISGSGIADHLYTQCLRDKIPALILVQYVSEGDNRIDAEILANHLDQLLWLRPQNDGSHSSVWTPPAAWNTLFGNSYPVELF